MRQLRTHEIEDWTLRIADRVQAHEPVEDFRVEIKSAWPEDAERAARRLAGHCNAAHGESVLWVVGLDEERGIVGASQNELANWWPEVQKHFSSRSPDLVRDMVVSVGDTSVVGLLFATDRAPFVVKNPAFGQPAGGPVETEVPWREGTSVRSARHEDLIRLLSPMQRLPEMTVLEAALTYHLGGKDAKGRPSSASSWVLRLSVYVVPASDDLLVIPFHQCEASFSVGAGIVVGHFSTIAIDPRVTRPFFTRDTETLSRTVDSTPTEVLFRGPGLAVLVAESRVTCDAGRATAKEVQNASYSVTMQAARSEHSVSLSGELVRASTQLADRLTWESPAG